MPGPLDECCYLLRMTRLCAVNPFVVGFTHGIGAIAGASAVQTAGAAAAAAVAFARKKIPVLARNANAPEAEVRAVPSRFSRFARGPPKMTTFAPARAWPPCVTRPVTVAPTPALAAFRAATVTAPAPIAAGDATVAAALTCPTPGTVRSPECDPCARPTG